MQVYIGATSIISSLGFTTDENFLNLLEYRSGIRTITDGAIAGHPFIGAVVDPQRLADEAERHGLVQLTRLEQLLVLSVQEVLLQSGINADDEECALIISTTKGNIDRLTVDEEPAPEVYLWGMAQRVARFLGFKCPPVVVSNACISGVSATIMGSRLIREGKYRHVVVAGGDLLTRFVLSGFAAFKSLSPAPCKPYDAARDGLSLGEGVATLLLTSDKALSGGVSVEGGAITNDANHISGPSRTGDGLYYAIEQALAESGASAGSVSFINAHGTATSFNDEMESKAIGLAGLTDIYTNSLKPYFGHTLGAAGVIELVVCAEQLKRGVAIGTKGFTRLGVPVPINVSDRHQQMEMQRCVKSASGFGGCNAAVVLALDEHAKEIAPSASVAVSAEGYCRIANGTVNLNGVQYAAEGADLAAQVRSIYRSLNAPNMKFFKMDNLCKLGYLAAELLLKEKSFSPLEVALVMANRSSSLDTDCHHLGIITAEGDQNASPAVFVYTLPNVVMGEICIRSNIKGENTFLINDSRPALLDDYAQMLLNRGGCRAVIVGWCDVFGEAYEADFKLLERR